MISNVSTVSNQAERASVELHYACRTILTQSKELAYVAQLRSSIKSVEVNMAFYKAYEEELKKEARGCDNRQYSG